MSQSCKDSIICPKCQTTGEFEYWSSINADLNPELKKKIFNEELFMWICPKCGAKVYVPYDTFYHDMAHKFMLFFTHDYPDEGEANESFEIPTVLGINKDYTFRSVHGIMSLKEKILILENNLNDVAVEKLKYTITHHMEPSMSEKGIKLFFEGVTKPDDEDKYGRIVFYCQGVSDSKHQDIGLSMQQYYEQCLSLELDDRFNVKDCACVDEDWISNRMKGVE